MSALASRVLPAAGGTPERVLVWAPHPDDEVLAAGMLIRRALVRGGLVHVTIATDGDNQSWAQRIVERRWRIGAVDRRRWGARRRDEALAGLRALGVGPDAVRFLGLPDRSVTAGLLAADDPVVTALADDLARVRPTLLVAPALEDRHPDHSALAVAARFALERSRAGAPAPALLRYVIHGPGLAGTTLRLAARDDERARKHDAILCHRSQVAVHRRRLLAFVEREEFAWADAAASDAVHPVRDLVRLHDAVRVCVALPRTRRRATLRLRAGADAASLIACAIPLPATTGLVAIAGGRHRAWCWRSRTHVVAVVPVPPRATARRWFAKLDAGDGWFDAAGWREFPAVHQQGGTEPGPHPDP